MRCITGGRPLPDAVIEEVRHRYGLIGRSPLTDITRAQAEGLQKTLGVPVYFGMRNWHPFIKDVVMKMLSDGVTSVVAICLAPQNSRTSVGLYRKALMEVAEGKMKIDFIDSWGDDTQLAEAFAARLRPAWDAARAKHGDKAAMLFTAHSVPAKTVEPQGDQPGDPYAEQCKQTAAHVAERIPTLAKGGWRFAFQSQGMSGGAWIGPTVEETLTVLAAEGKKAVVLQPIGFVCDHVEILYDIDIAFRKFAAEKGLELTRAESLNDSPEFIAALAKVVRPRLTM